MIEAWTTMALVWLAALTAWVALRRVSRSNDQ